LNYRRFKKGEIDKKEFWYRMRLNSVVGVGSLAAGSGGAAAGFALGTVLFPGVGSVIGAVVGGIAGGFAGEKISATAYKALEEKIAESKAKKKERKREKYFKHLEQTCHVSHERFDEALQTLGLFSYRVSVSDIQEAYLKMLEMIADGKRGEEQMLNESAASIALDEER
jgi:ADP-ribosylglycohydrolase